MNINYKRIVENAQSLVIDPFLNVSIEKRGENSWALFMDNSCMDKIEKDFIQENIPSERSEDFITRTRFGSIEECLSFYNDFRNNNCYIIGKTKTERRWFLFSLSENFENEKKNWEFLLDTPRSLFGYWVFVGKNNKVVFTIRNKNAESIEFYDFFTELFSE